MRRARSRSHMRPTERRSRRTRWPGYLGQCGHIARSREAKAYRTRAGRDCGMDHGAPLRSGPDSVLAVDEFFHALMRSRTSQGARLTLERSWVAAN